MHFRSFEIEKMQVQEGERAVKGAFDQQKDYGNNE